MNQDTTENSTLDPRIEVNDFSKAYDGTLAVSNITFQVQPGEVLGVIGPNGAGKTTTMRSIAALLPPSHGRIRVCGQSVIERPVDVKRQLAYIPDDPQLFPHLTVDEHLAFTASAYRVSRADEQATRLCRQFELADKRRVVAKDLSRGMRQKLAICCAYLYDPTVILFDEPLTGLDPYGIRVLKQSILDRASAGAAVLVSSHLLAMVEDICSHILMLDQGQTRFSGPIGDLRSRFLADDADASLENIFFMATDTEGRVPAEV